MIEMQTFGQTTALQKAGVTVLRGVLPLAMLATLRALALARLKDRHSATLESRPEFLEPLVELGFDPADCRVADSWIRRKGPPNFQAHLWHQDGGLGVSFPPEPGPPLPMTPLLTVWAPLDPCGVDAPGLEFVRRRIEALLHFSELPDEKIRSRFAPDDFWAPTMEPGDAAIFLNGTLHRTHAHPEMPNTRISVEYRLALRSESAG